MERACAASDCINLLGHMASSAKYCSNQCRWRESKRNVYKNRVAKRKCVQCGGAMDFFTFTPAPSYCTKCQKYYHDRYIRMKKD